MNIGLLLLLNISTVPFLYEFEQIAIRGISPGASVFALRHFRRARWSWGFGLLWLFFLLLVLAPTAPGKNHTAGFGLFALVLAIQIGLWGYAFYRARLAKNRRQEERSDA